MKRILVVILFVSAIDAGAQTSYGIKGGINLSYIRYVVFHDDIYLNDIHDLIIPPNGHLKASVTPVIRTSAGFFLQQDFSKKTGMRVELLYQGEGAKSVTLNGASSNSSGLKLDYLMIPMSFVWRPHSRITMMAGHYVSYLIHDNRGPKQDFADRIDYGLNAGAEFNATKKISVGLAYYYGISNILPTGGESATRIRNGQLYLRYSIRSK